MKLARGICAACGREVALRKNGVTREHHVYLSQLEQDPTKHLGRLRVCPGSGKKAVR